MDNGTFGTRHCNHFNARGERQYTWALYDAQGIYCCRVCDACEEAVKREVEAAAEAVIP